jgi:predicted AAA+ superfamily ATPase
MATYIERDVRQLLNITSIRDFARYMRACAIRSGQLLNKTELAKDVGVSAKTINDWLAVLQASNQITLLEPYYTNLGKRLVKSPKIYLNDVGLLCFLMGLNKNSILENYLMGAIWETFVFSELRKALQRRAPEATLWFYRDQSREVDFVIERGLRALLIEAKWTEYPQIKDCKQLLESKKLFKSTEENAVVLCRTPNTYPLRQNLFAVSGFDVRSLL